MPKKSTAARSAAQRNKPKAQKGFELVRPVSPAIQDQGSEDQNRSEVATTDLSTATTATQVAAEVPEESKPVAVSESAAKPGKSAAAPQAPKTPVRAAATTEAARTSESAATPKGSAAARLAARRQAAQKTQQRNSATLITAEHFAYVRKDLVTIGILAAMMAAIIIILYFVPGLNL